MTYEIGRRSLLGLRRGGSPSFFWRCNIRGRRGVEVNTGAGSQFTLDRRLLPVVTIQPAYTVVTTKSFAKALSRIPVNWQKRIVGKIKEVAADPYGKHNNVSKLQGREGYRLRIGDWRVIYELHDDCLELWVLEVGVRGGVY